MLCLGRAEPPKNIGQRKEKSVNNLKVKLKLPQEVSQKLPHNTPTNP
jgi:hypothetical protein